jgi:hypothetical protein
MSNDPEELPLITRNNANDRRGKKAFWKESRSSLGVSYFRLLDSAGCFIRAHSREFAGN